jgi:hypothetical protein
MAVLVAFRFAAHRGEGNERSKQRQRGFTQPDRQSARQIEIISGADLGEIDGPLSHYSPARGKQR